MAFRKGDAALSESMMNIISLILSFVLIVFVVKGIFVPTSDQAYQSTFLPIARDIATSIDRTAALAGSQQTYLKFPDGLSINITIDNKLVTVIYDKGIATKTFGGLIHSGPYFFENPKGLCFVKNRDDRRITIVPGECRCKMGDGRCDPACIIDFKCDPDCKTEVPDNFCSKFCSNGSDSMCDPDCYTNENDMICLKSCVKPDEEDGVCDPDCNGTKKGVCDMDCFSKYNGTQGYGGVCDPDCKPIDANNDSIEDASDGICYTGCANKKSGDIVRMPKDGICDLDCAGNNSVCDPDCNLDEDCEDKCANVGENCSSMPCCQANGPEVCCPGAKVCADASNPSSPACCGNGICEPSPLVKKIYPNLISYIDKYQPTFSENSATLNWENYYTCPEDCVSRDFPHPTATEPAGWFVDGVCDRSVSNSMDPDCCELPLSANPPFCNFTPCLLCDTSGGSATDPPYFGLKKGVLNCDPDVAWGSSSSWGNNAPDPCPVNRAGSTVKDQAASDGICAPMDDGKCDSDCASNTRMCDPDCCTFNSASACATSPGCYCPARSNMSENFKKAPSFFDTNPANLTDKVYWTDNVIEVCSDTVIKYLDRRGWDIKQVEMELKMPDPLGFGFDGSRYSTIRNSQGKCTPQEQGSFTQTASKTITANENYNMSTNYCCTYYCGRCGPAAYTGPLCDGIGFCGDHAVAILSILRTLGVPPYDVYAVISSSQNPQFRHAYVVYFCDPALPENLKLAACAGNENKWLRVDATWHEITTFEGSDWCNRLCLAYNDYGPFAQIDASRYGFGGMRDSSSGYAFPVRNMGGTALSGGLNSARAMNCNTDSSCLLNRADKSNPGLCDALGVQCLT